MAKVKHVPEKWTCPTCATELTSAYCPTCGERPVLPRDLTVRGLLRQFFDAVSSIDGRLIRSLRTVLMRPGALTVAWVRGPRKPYMGPFQLFLLANVIFVAAQSLTGTNAFSSTLDSHLNRQDWDELAQRLVANRLESTHTTLEAYAPVFNRKVAFHAKSLVILMALTFSLLLPVLFVKSRKPFALHVVFSVHVYAFILILYSAVSLVSAADVMRGGQGLDSARMDTILTVLYLAVCFAYLYVATNVVYGAKGVARIATSLALAAAILAITLAYRFGLFLFTLYVT